MFQWEHKSQRQSGVAVLDAGQRWCCAVVFSGGKDGGGLDLLTALLHTAGKGEKTLAAAVPPLSTHFISSNTALGPLLREHPPASWVHPAWPWATRAPALLLV